ncbi:45549_t:CDS:2, partial [Gigaspora margarita]
RSDTNYITKKLAQLVQEQRYDNQEFIQLDYKQLNNGESNSSKETNDFNIQESLEQALKKYEAEIGFKAIKFRIE